MSNAYASEILSSVSARIGAERLIVADQWIRDRLVEISADGIGSSAQNLVGSHAEHRWMIEPGTVLDGVRRLMDGSAESVNMIQMPARWLVRGLFWSLSTDLPGTWLVSDAIAYYEEDFPRLATALFEEGSPSLDLLLPHLSATDPVRDRLALLGGAMWSLSILTVWTGVLLAQALRPEALDRQPVPAALAVDLCADLADEFFPADHPWPKIRDLSRRRQARARAEQGTAGEEE